MKQINNYCHMMKKLGLLAKHCFAVWLHSINWV